MTVAQRVREKRLVLSVQRAKRAYLKKQELYRAGKASQQAVETARRVWRERRDKLAAFRESLLTERQKLARAILKHRRTVFRLPTLGGTARVGLEQAARGEKSKVAATGGKVDISTPLLRTILATANGMTSGYLWVNCIVNGTHGAGTSGWYGHYYGLCVDFDKESDVTTGELEREAERHGGRCLDEDAGHWHCKVPY